MSRTTFQVHNHSQLFLVAICSTPELVKSTRAGEQRNEEPVIRQIRYGCRDGLGGKEEELARGVKRRREKGVNANWG